MNGNQTETQDKAELDRLWLEYERCKSNGDSDAALDALEAMGGILGMFPGDHDD